MGAAYARARYDIADPRVGLLSIGEEPGKGDPLRKETYALLVADGVLAGRRRPTSSATSRAATSSPTRSTWWSPTASPATWPSRRLEGGMKGLVNRLLEAFGANEETRAAADVLMPELLPLYATLDPENTGGAMLLGVDGVCIISHGSSRPDGGGERGPRGRDMVAGEVTSHLAAAVA